MAARRPGPRGRGPGVAGPMGVDVFGELEDLDRVARGKIVRVQDPTGASPLKAGALVPIEGEPIGVMQVTQVDLKAIHLITVQIDREDIQESNNCDLRCRIRWGVGGARDFLECDWADGGLISIVADELWVDAIPFRPVDFSAYVSAGFERLLSCCVGLGGNDAIPPQWTSAVRRIAPAGFFDFPIPAYTRAVSLVAHYSPGAPNLLASPYPDLVLELNQSLPFFPIGLFTGDTIVGGAAVPVSNAANARVHNIGADNIDTTVIFHLGV